VTTTPPEQAYVPPRVHADLEVHYVKGSLWQALANIARGETAGLTPQEYARHHLERMSDPEQHIEAVGGRSRDQR
jgi:hypothetical protein